MRPRALGSPQPRPEPLTQARPDHPVGRRRTACAAKRFAPLTASGKRSTLHGGGRVPAPPGHRRRGADADGGPMTTTLVRRLAGALAALALLVTGALALAGPT